MYSAHEITGGFAPKKVLKYYGHKCFEGLSYKGMQKYLCKSYICSLNLYVFLNVFAVEAYVASWIEIALIDYLTLIHNVEAYVASWIEIGLTVYARMITSSRLTQPRGLKYYVHICIDFNNGRGLRSLVD